MGAVITIFQFYRLWFFLCFLNLNSESQSYKMKKSLLSLGKLYHYSFLRNGKQIYLKMWSGNQQSMNIFIIITMEAFW